MQQGGLNNQNCKGEHHDGQQFPKGTECLGEGGCTVPAMTAGTRKYSVKDRADDDSHTRVVSVDDAQQGRGSRLPK